MHTKLLMKFRRYPYMKGLGNQDIIEHCIKTQPHSTEAAGDLHMVNRFMLPFYKEVHFNSICQ